MVCIIAIAVCRKIISLLTHITHCSPLFAAAKLRGRHDSRLSFCLRLQPRRKAGSQAARTFSWLSQFSDRCNHYSQRAFPLFLFITSTRVESRQKIEVEKWLRWCCWLMSVIFSYTLTHSALHTPYWMFHAQVIFSFCCFSCIFLFLPHWFLTRREKIGTRVCMGFTRAPILFRPFLRAFLHYSCMLGYILIIIPLFFSLCVILVLLDQHITQQLSLTAMKTIWRWYFLCNGYFKEINHQFVWDD